MDLRRTVLNAAKVVGTKATVNIATRTSLAEKLLASACFVIVHVS
jgi:hypothetical protein